MLLVVGAVDMGCVRAVRFYDSDVIFCIIPVIMNLLRIYPLHRHIPIHDYTIKRSQGYSKSSVGGGCDIIPERRLVVLQETRNLDCLHPVDGHVSHLF